MDTTNEIKRTAEQAGKLIDKWTVKLAKRNVAFVASREKLIQELIEFNDHTRRFKTLFKRTDITYEHLTPVNINSVIHGQIKIWTDKEKRDKRADDYKLTSETAGQLIDKWNVKLAKYNVAFMTPREELIQELIKSKSKSNGARPDHINTFFKRTDITYEHPTPVQIAHVIHGRVKIWTPEEKLDKQRSDVKKNTPRSIDSNGNKETGRTHKLLDLCLKLKAKYGFHETIRGSLVDIIGTISKLEAFGIQIATSDGSLNGQFNFHKVVSDIIYCLIHNLIVILIGVKDDGVVGVYVFFPTPETIAELTPYSEMCVSTCMISHKKSKNALNMVMKKHRYLTDIYSTVVADNFKSLAQFETDMIDFIEKNYSQVVKSPFYLRSLFKSSSDKCEWAANVLFEQYMVETFGMSMTPIHGQRGDFTLEYTDKNSNTVRIRNEHKVAKVANYGKGKLLVLPMRERGRQGLNPEIVDFVISFLRKQRNAVTPSEPDDFTGFSVWPIVTLDGEPGLRPDDLASRGLYFSWDPNDKNEWIRIVEDKIGANLFPDRLTREGQPTVRGQRTIEVRAVFYYENLSERIDDLYELMALRSVNQSAIDAYKNAVTDELIEEEKNKLTQLRASG